MDQLPESVDDNRDDREYAAGYLQISLHPSVQLPQEGKGGGINIDDCGIGTA